MILEDSDVITTEFLPLNLTEKPAAASFGSSGLEIRDNVLHLPLQNLSVKNLENSLLRWALEESGGNKSQAARLLGITRDQLIYRLKTMDDASPNENE